MSQFFSLLDVPRSAIGEKRRYCSISGCSVSYQRDVSKAALKKHAMMHNAQPSVIDMVTATHNASLPEQAAKTFAVLNWALHHSEKVYKLFNSCNSFFIDLIYLFAESFMYLIIYTESVFKSGYFITLYKSIVSKS